MAQRQPRYVTGQNYANNCCVALGTLSGSALAQHSEPECLRPLNFSTTMNGWMRLWVLLSIVWVVIVVTFTGIALSETSTEPRVSSIWHELSEAARPFYEGLNEAEQGPMFTQEFAYTDGTIQGIRFPLLDDSTLTSVGDKVRRLAADNGKQVSDVAVAAFSELVARRNRQAQAAKTEFDRIASAYASDRLEERRSVYIAGAAFALIPPFIVLLLGVGIAWVRRGFNPAK